MELLTTSILTLLALYVLYSEPFKLPAIIKKNKKLSYILIIGLYLYYYQNNLVEGYQSKKPLWTALIIVGVVVIIVLVPDIFWDYLFKFIGWIVDGFFKLLQLLLSPLSR
jgi:hypothetical protein